MLLKLYLKNLLEGRNFFGVLASVVLFFGGPAGIFLSYALMRRELSDATISTLVSSFSIFSAMLFASQVAAFSVFQATISSALQDPRTASEDKIEAEASKNTAAIRVKNLRDAFRKINAGISCLTFMAMFVVILSISTTADSISEWRGFLDGALCALVFHFGCAFFITCHQVFHFFDLGYRESS